MTSIDALFDSIADLPSLPKVVQEVMQMLDGENVDINVLAHKVEFDAVISAKVLRLANSPYYGVTRTIKTIDDAIAILGLSKLRTLVIASGVTGAVSHVAGLDLKKFWQHGFVTASISRDIAKTFKKDLEIAYIAGLLHNIGQLLICMLTPDCAVEINSATSIENRCDIERACVGWDHCLVGEELAKRWNFPSEISRVLRYYATPLAKEASPMAPIVYMAAYIASHLQLGVEAQHIVETLNTEVAKALNMQSAEWVERIESYRDFVGEVQALM